MTPSFRFAARFAHPNRSAISSCVYPSNCRSKALLAESYSSLTFPVRRADQSRGRATSTRRWKQRSQRCWAAESPPALRSPIQRVPEPSSWDAMGRILRCLWRTRASEVIVTGSGATGVGTRAAVFFPGRRPARRPVSHVLVEASRGTGTGEASRG